MVIRQIRQIGLVGSFRVKSYIIHYREAWAVDHWSGKLLLAAEMTGTEYASQ
jgi:hypothetical protein